MTLKRFIFALTILFVLLVAVPFYIPVESYLPRLEQVVSEKAGVPVKMGSLHVALLPTPRLTIRDVVVGRDAEIQVKEVSAALEVRTLFDAVKVISHLDIKQPVLKQTALELIGAMASTTSGPDTAAPVAVRRVVLREARLEWPGMNLPELGGVVGMLPGNKLGQADLASTDGKLKLTAQPAGQGLDLALEAKQWTPPAGPALVFDALKAQAQLVGSHLVISSFNAALYEGTAVGSAEIDWSKAWKVSGKLKVIGMEMSKPVRLVSKAVWVSGKMTGNGTFAATAPSPAELRDHASVGFKFNVAHGVLHGVDLAKAASLFVKQGQSGGETEFDLLSGVFQATGKQYELHDLQVASGLLAANGRMKVAPAKQLNGQVDVELKKGLALVTVPLQISGTADAPVVMPTKAAVAGAAAGTAVLGPLGTSLGMKAGSALGRWFGDKK